MATLWAASTFSAGQLWAQTTAEPGQAKELSRFAGVETPVTGRRQIFGMVIEQRKYSLRVASGEEDLEIALPDGVPIDQRLDKPRLDLESHLLTQELPASQAEGAEFGKPVEFQLSLPHPLGLLAEFSHPNERRRLLSDNPKRLIRYRLLPLEALPAKPDTDLLLAGEVKAVESSGQVRLIVGKEELLAELGSRDARLGNRSIADLRPFECEVEVLADWLDNRWVAQEILFRQIAPQKRAAEQPRLLLLGDEVSLSYLHSLRRQLAGKYTVHHPPENCRGSAQWIRLPLWLGPYRQAGYEWDLILFNVGLGDLATTEDKYRESLRTTTELMSRTNAKLIWLSTMPLPAAWEPSAGTGGKLSRAEAQAKIARLNQIADEVFKDYPQVARIDLASRMESERDGLLRQWAEKSGVSFPPEQSELIAAWIIEALAD